MATFSEVEYAAFQAVTGKSGTIKELMLDYFGSLLGYTPASVHEGWLGFLQRETLTTGTYEELLRKYLISAGINASTLRDMLFEFYSTGGLLAGANRLLLEDGFNLLTESGSVLTIEYS